MNNRKQILPIIIAAGYSLLLQAGPQYPEFCFMQALSQVLQLRSTQLNKRIECGR
jgi:hypothetical protein